jgi:LacI family transcriptional regulator
MSGLKEIAKECGLSANTVSRALRGKGYISDDALKKVLETAEKLNYRPNRAAQALKTRQLREIVVIASDADELNMEKIQAAKQYFDPFNYNVRIYFESEDLRNGKNSMLDAAINESPSGFLIVNSANSVDYYKKIEKSGLPCVAIPHNQNESIGDSVCIDRKKGINKSINYLTEQGRKKIYYLGKNLPNCPKLQGYREAMQELSLEPKSFFLEKSGIDNAYEQARDWAIEISKNKNEMPDAVQTFSDFMASGLLAGFQKAGLIVPDDVAVIGFDNRQIASLTNPRLTTLGQLNRETGTLASEILLNKIENKPERKGRPRLLPMELIVRESA